MWASYDCYLTAARDILGLRLPPHEKYKAWEECAIHGGFRWVHEEFCMVSDFPEVLKVDDQNRPHCDDGPSHRWRDGWELYHIHGVKVTRQIVIAPESLTVRQIAAEENTEVRRVMMERLGWERFCSGAKMRVLHEDELHSKFPSIPVSELVGEGQRMVTSYRAGVEKAQLLEAAELKDFEDRPLRFVRLSDPSTARQYTIRVLHSHRRCYEAVGWTFPVKHSDGRIGLSEAEYKKQIMQHS